MTVAKVVTVSDARDQSDHLRLKIWCPGCKSLKMLPINGTSDKRPNWQFDGNLEKPTLSPSIKTSYYMMSDEGEAAAERGDAPGPDGRYHGHEYVCHSFLKAGRWEFLSDCTHELKSQTVDMQPLPVPPPDLSTQTASAEELKS